MEQTGYTGGGEMIITGKCHLFFEQSGTFKREFIKLGYPAEDYDIQDNFGETDHVMDLFKEIDTAYAGGESIFDEITQDDVVFAFYPCIYFCATSQMLFSIGSVNYRCMTDEEKIEKILERDNERSEFYRRLIKLVAVCLRKGIRLIIENPWSEQTYLKANFLKAPDVVDNNRMVRGDYYKKPTAFWFWNCEPTYDESFQYDKKPKTIRAARGSAKAGVCSEERSLISSDYARNFICDFVIGKNQNGQTSLFEEETS